MKQKATKSKSSPKRVKVILGKRFYIGALAVLVILVAGAQITFDIYAHNQYANRNDSVITNLIVMAVEGLRKPAPVDPVTGKVYFTEAHLVLPPADPYVQVRYEDTGSSSQTELSVTTTNLLTQGESKLWDAQATISDANLKLHSIFDEVPSLQACARGVQIFSQPSTNTTPQFQLKATKKVADGRTLYFYTETTCHEDVSALLSYLQKVESY